MTTVAQQQAANPVPPRKGAVLVFTVDTTARSYDLSQLALGGHTPNAANSSNHAVYVTLEAETADVYFVFSSDSSATLTTSGAISAGGAVAFDNAYCKRIPAGVTTDAIRIDRNVDKYLHLRSSSAALLRVYASSESAVR